MLRASARRDSARAVVSTSGSVTAPRAAAVLASALGSSLTLLLARVAARWDLAIRDAELHFPAAADAFSCALGIPVTEEDTPSLYMLMRRTLTDAGLAPYAAKNAYQRERPFVVSGEPICTPDDEEALRKDGSYPSGHTAIGWGWALILTELVPERAEAILARGRAFGESRNVCNVHWYSDVVAGRMAGAAAVAKLHANEEFLAAMAAARADIDRARQEGLSPEKDCAAEEAALSTWLTLRAVEAARTGETLEVAATLPGTLGM